MKPTPSTITSRANPQFKALKLLASSSRERRRQGRMILDGSHLVSSLFDRGLEAEFVAVSEDALDDAEVAALVRRAGSACVVSFAPALFSQIAPVDHPTGILAVARIPTLDAGHPLGAVVVALDGVQDPGNVGTIIRTAAAAGATDVLLSAGCADPWAPRTLRAGMGGQFALSVHVAVDIGAVLNAFAGTIIATAVRGGHPPEAVDMRGRVAYLFGSEGSGLGAELTRKATTEVTIPLAPGAESLNVAAAAAVLLFERMRQLRGQRATTPP